MILGGYTYILKGIEVYKGEVIFYSLNNFACGLGPGTLGMKINTGTARKLTEFYGTMHHPEAKATIIAKAIIEDGEIKQVSSIPYSNRDDPPLAS